MSAATELTGLRDFYVIGRFAVVCCCICCRRVMIADRSQTLEVYVDEHWANKFRELERRHLEWRLKREGRF